MYLLDTCVVCELRKAHSGTADPNVVEWIEVRPLAAFHVSALTLLELELGIAATERSDLRRGKSLREWLDRQVLVAFERRVLPIDVAVVARRARLHDPDRIPERDALMVATALANGLSLVTRGAAGFARTGVICQDPWT